MRYQLYTHHYEPSSTLLCHIHVRFRQLSYNFQKLIRIFFEDGFHDGEGLEGDLFFIKFAERCQKWKNGFFVLGASEQVGDVGEFIKDGEHDVGFVVDEF